MTFTLIISIIHFNLNLTLKDIGTMLRRNLKKVRISEEFHQDPYHPSTFMKIIKERTQTISASNDESLQFLPSKVFCDIP
jgi:hypothetical protein